MYYVNSLLAVSTNTKASSIKACNYNFVGVSRGYTDHHQGRGHSIMLTAALINIHEHLI